MAVYLAPGYCYVDWTGGGQVPIAGFGYVDRGASSGLSETIANGTLTFSGQSVGFKLLTVITNGSFTLAGQDISFVHQQAGVYTVALDPGIITFSSANSYSDIGALLEPGTITFSGRNLNLVWSGDPVIIPSQTTLSIANKIGL